MNRVTFKSLTFTLFLGAAMSANADVILNTFGTVTSPGFDSTTSWTVASFQSMAKPFTPSFGSYTLDEIDIPLTFLNATSAINVNLCVDIGGSPSTVLETFTVFNAGTLGSGSNYVLTSASNPLMFQGVTYYITMTPADANTSGGWNRTNDGHSGAMKVSSNSGASWSNLTSTDGAVTVKGSLTTVPEPASLAVLGLGACALIRRRRWVQ